MRKLKSTRDIIFLFIASLIMGGIQTVAAQKRAGLTVREISLDELIGLATQNNLDLKMSQKDSAIAVENIKATKILKAPYVNVGGNYNFVGNPVLYRGFYSNDTIIDYYHHQASWNVAAGLPVYLGGRIKTQIAQSETFSSIQNELLLMTENKLKLSIITQFYLLYKLYREVEIIEENIKNVKINIKQLESRVANGQNLVSDLLRTQLQLSNFEIEVFKAWNSIDLQSNYLCILSGLPTNTRIQPRSVVLAIPADSIRYDQCLQDAFLNRNEIKQSLLQKNLSELTLKVTQSAAKPAISASAIYSSEFPVPGTFPPQPDILNYWAVGIGLSYDLSSIYNLKHRIKADKIQIQKEDDNISNVRNLIEQDVKNSYVNFIESKTNIVAYRQNVERAELNYRIVKSKYDNEFALIIDMIDAELQVNDSKLSLNKAIIEAIIQYYSLLYSMGKLN
ncbi:TolC family protein [Solitalea canadensis]|uniref:Outer membrane protein n=1 Tax=Solitalea canadensis (strain ATCC 29591 / DSM 3403 / JCM 21819 / LMG 8368 / NBRC 15130 / NCIMB 12057 / USAM 9D) TaxID=929556 RepID=H8KST4_SOLCM|nr:TolC family protein [Solitalea canadensis]AFD05228.1 outer membrane protein [Solitalea canadensis DSM 3403]